METRYIKPPISKPRGLLLIISLAAFIALGLTVFLVPAIKSAAVAILLLAIVTLLIIAIKQAQEPELSFTLTFMHIQFHSPSGGWLARWKNIAEIGPATIANQGWHQPIPWVGIRLKDYEEFLDAICPRIASKILLEQRALLFLAYKRMDNPPHEIEDMLFDDTHYIGRSGKTFKGLLAMLANRMQYNRELLGYDFFISEDLLDRSTEDFVGLTRRYLAAS
ncbi:hypothetical protein BIT28_21765 [Photobacterium proteolyticum]|uniref:DUF2982 domain-containing protein n=1 Tax=Photobacterium proteolyticum TaxID=1903952 RepID=A0A1Q9GFY7_9GAMM|nr:DUF2982 domain-containing protein [Photobacterium proteolyticum]OLQ73357.1 hypothetical protein BIT28_21765 [Photobacterium proteolyticum]